MSAEEREKKLDTIEKIMGMTYRGIEPQPMPVDWEKSVIASLRQKRSEGVPEAPVDQSPGCLLEESPEGKVPFAFSGRMAWLIVVLLFLGFVLLFGLEENRLLLEEAFRMVPDAAALRRFLDL
jgi:hypothetical protein